MRSARAKCVELVRMQMQRFATRMRCIASVRGWTIRVLCVSIVSQYTSRTEHVVRRTLKKSNLHFHRAVKRLPLGVSSNFRYWGEGRTIYAQRGKGARLWDIDG